MPGDASVRGKQVDGIDGREGRFEMRRALLLVAVVTLAVGMAIPAIAARSQEATEMAPKAAEGIWTWVNTGAVTWKTANDGTEYVTGIEDGTWTGTFEGSSTDAFDGEIRDDGSLWGLLRVAFEGTVFEKTGTLEILTTWVVPRKDPSEPMSGRWRIVSGTDELADFHGEGTWVYDTEVEGARYSGVVKEVAPPA